MNAYTDLDTGLTWMRFAVGQKWHNGQSIGEAQQLTWSAALASAENDNRIGFAGHKDWRVPDIDELKTLILQHWHNPCCNHEAFPGGTGWFWSASSYAGYSAYAWYVNFDNGNDLWNGKSRHNRVRLVRGGQ